VRKKPKRNGRELYKRGNQKGLKEENCSERDGRELQHKKRW
jgi:hypothetical protein